MWNQKKEVKLAQTVYAVYEKHIKSLLIKMQSA